MQKHGDIYPVKDESGRTKCLIQLPQVAIANRLAAQLTRLEQKFGMTPSAATRISVSVAPIFPMILRRRDSSAEHDDPGQAACRHGTEFPRRGAAGGRPNRRWSGSGRGCPR